ncbi:glycosyltransferase family 25 protein [Thiomicrospira microaerophila]|uniref:glycosyltransferase family 25 protein n=1 Tax=Thiomicrospira microaerophila TaxID=406020 RepID=UPI0005CB6FA6|nr:glycosyltransferase family 25 protein [Thiomicrospira microaerophila]
MLKNIKIKIISLKKDEYKRSMVLSELREIDLLRYAEVFDAVDGRLLPKNILEDVNRYRRAYPYTHFDRDLSAGELGCLKSHLEIFNAIEEGQVCLVLEDDVTLSKDLVDFIQKLDELPPAWELVLLGHRVEGGLSWIKGARISLWERKKLGDSMLGKPVDIAWGTHGYLINYKGAQRLIAQLKRIDAPIDHYTGITKSLNVYAVQPPLVLVSDELGALGTLEEQREEVLAKNKENTPINLRNASFRSYLKALHLYQPARNLLIYLRKLKNSLRVLKKIRRYY